MPHTRKNAGYYRPGDDIDKLNLDGIQRLVHLNVSGSSPVFVGEFIVIPSQETLAQARQKGLTEALS